jgi:DNA-binding CsgD family transcriptional regulator
VSYGLVNAEIGGELSLSEELVRRVLADVLSKFGVASRAALVGAGFRHGPLRPRAASPGAVGRAAGLSPSLAVLAPLVAEGLTDGQIAARLSSEPGVRVTARAAHSRMQILRTRLGARSREHLVRLAVESGLLVVSPDGARLVLAAAAPGFGGAR